MSEQDEKHTSLSPTISTAVSVVDIFGLGAVGRAILDAATRSWNKWSDSEALIRDGKAKVDLEVYREIRMAEAKALASMVAQTPTNDLADAIRHRIQNQEIRKQLNIENILLDAAQIAADTDPAADAEPVSDDWFQRYLSYAAEVSDTDIRKIFGEILASQFSADRTSISLLTLDTLRFLESRQAEAFESLVYLIASFGTYVVNTATLDRYVNSAHLDYLVSIGLAEKTAVSFNDGARIYIREGWTLRWDIGTPVGKDSDPYYAYRLSFQGRELRDALFPELRPRSSIDFTSFLQPEARRGLLREWANGFGLISREDEWPKGLPGIWVIPGIIGATRATDIQSKTAYLSHVWHPNKRCWLRTPTQVLPAPPEIDSTEEIPWDWKVQLASVIDAGTVGEHP